MEDKEIKDLFADFQPGISSSFGFMTKLKRNMEAVEIVKRHNSALRKRNRIAVATAAVCGFFMGVCLTLLFPVIGGWISTFAAPLLQFGGFAVDFTIVWWIVVAAVSVITSLNTYEIAMAKLAENG